jgi:hypothetical protein
MAQVNDTRAVETGKGCKEEAHEGRLQDSHHLVAVDDSALLHYANGGSKTLIHVIAHHF